MAKKPNSTEGLSVDQLSADQAADAEDTRYKPDWSRQDRPRYGELGHGAHEKLYEGWRTNSRIPNLPRWKEMDNATRAEWMNSSQGSKIVNAARRELKVNNFSDVAERPVRSTDSGARGGTSAEGDAKWQAEYKARKKVKSAVAGVTITPEQAPNITSRYGFGDDFSHHQNLGAVVDKLEKSHNGTNSSVPALVAAARGSISNSIAEQTTGNGNASREAAKRHFTDAAGHTMRLAQAVAGAAHNSGEQADARGAMVEANTHLTNYRKYVDGIKKVN